MSTAPGRGHRFTLPLDRTTSISGRVSRILSARVAEPDPDRGDVDGAVVDELALVGAHRDGAERLEPVVRALGGVALLVGLGVERGLPPAGGALGQAGLLLVALLRNGGLDPAAPQVGADRPVRVGLVGQEPTGTCAGSSPTRTADPQPAQQRLEGDRVVALPGGGAPGQRSAPGVGEQVNLGAQSTAGTAQTLPINPGRRRRTLVVRPSPLCGPRAARKPPVAGRGAASPPAARRGCPWAAGDGRPRRADERGSRWSRSRRSTPRCCLRRTRPGADPGSTPTCHLPTSGDAGSRRPSSSRTSSAGPARAPRFARATTPR